MLSEKLLDLLGPKEAEAGVFDDLFGKRAVPVAAGKTAKYLGRSSAADRLVGMEIQGKIIKDVQKGVQDWRYIIFEDDTQQAVKKRVVHELSRERGNQVYLGDLKLKQMAEDTDGMLRQAINSLIYRRQRQDPRDTKSLKTIFDRERRQIASEAGVAEPTKYIWVESERIYMPRDYAEVLDANGVVKIKLRKPNESAPE